MMIYNRNKNLKGLNYLQSLKKAISLPHPLQEDHLLSRSYLPSAAGQAAFYQVQPP
jgi:hypothetical protein